MNVLGALLTLILSAVVLSGSRRAAALGVMAGVCYLTQAQELAILGFHFTAIRFILLAGLIRVVGRGELAQRRSSPIDRAVIYYILGISLISIIRVLSLAQLVYETGLIYNFMMAYFVLRGLLNEDQDVINVISGMAFLVIPLVLMLFLEANTGNNVFTVFGGVGTMMRDGHYRSQGAFRSPITAGSFGATFGLLFTSMIFAGIQRKRAILGLVISTLVVMLAHSGGPLMGYLVGFLTLACWRYRESTRKIRWGIVISLIVLNMVMKSPVWFLLGRVSEVVGGGGYHRAYIIDQYVRTFGSTWMLGTSDLHGWMATSLEDGQADLTNQFVLDGIRGGLLGLILSIMVVVRCFQQVGKALSERDLAGQKFAWGLGSTLVGSIAIIFSVTYFDQMHVIWYFLLACIACISRSAPDYVVSEDEHESETDPIYDKPSVGEVV